MELALTSTCIVTIGENWHIRWRRTKARTIRAAILNFGNIWVSHEYAEVVSLCARDK